MKHQLRVYRKMKKCLTLHNKFNQEQDQNFMKMKKKGRKGNNNKLIR